MAVLDNEHWRAIYYGNMPQGQKPPKGSMIQDAKDKRYPIIQFYDYTASIGDVYAGIDVLMLASNAEAFSLTLLESWLTRTPVVSTSVGSVPELEQKYGELTFGVPLHPTPEQLAAACQRAISVEGIPIIEKAYKLAREQFTARAMADRWAVYLDSILSKPSKHSVMWRPAAEVEAEDTSSKVVVDLDL
jgi:glycosyltransferase involved in cell wall biosynthesis